MWFFRKRKINEELVEERIEKAKAAAYYDGYYDATNDMISFMTDRTDNEWDKYIEKCDEIDCLE